MLHAFLAVVLFLYPRFTPKTDDGISIDPNGGRAGAVLDHRCTIDPNGCSVDTLAGDRGAGLDPDGRG